MRFYEKDANTISIGDDSDIVEKLYQRVEDNVKASIMRARSVTNVEEIENAHDLAHLIVFIVLTYWRIPGNVKVKNFLRNFYRVSKAEWQTLHDILNTTHITEKDKNTLLNFVIPFEIFRDRDVNKTKGKQTLFKVVDFVEPVFVISDNPIVLNNPPKFINDFQKSLIFPLNKSRVLVLLGEGHYTYDNELIILTNFLLFEQSHRYVGFCQKDTLEKFVSGYKLFKEGVRDVSILKQHLFDRVNKRIEKISV